MKTWGGNFLLQATDIDMVREAHEAVGLSLDVGAGQSEKFHCKTSGVIAEDFSIYYKTYGAASVLNAPPASDYWLSIPVAQVQDELGQSRFCVVHRPSRMACPGKNDPLHLPEGAQGLGIRFEQNALARRLTELTGKRVKGTITFASEFYAESIMGQTIASLAILAARSPEDWTPLSNPIFKATFSDMIASILLMNSPHSHDALLSDQTYSESLAVRNAIEYIHSHLDTPIRLSDLATISGIPVRTEPSVQPCHRLFTTCLYAKSTFGGSAYKVAARTRKINN